MPNRHHHLAHELLAQEAFLARLARGLVGNDADDLVQDVWQRALERPPGHGRDPRAWLARVARNLASNRRRGEARRTEREAQVARTAAEVPSGEELETRFELRRELVRALARLAEPYRGTLLLRYFEGLAPAEIARREGIPRATVKTRLRRGLEQLRSALDHTHGGDRRAWMSGLATLAAPPGSGAATGAGVIGGIAMGTIGKLSATVLVAAVGVFLVTRAVRERAPTQRAAAPLATESQLAAPSVPPPAEDVAVARAQRSAVAAQTSDDAAGPVRTDVLRVVLEGIDDDGARDTTVTVRGVDKRIVWPDAIRASWTSLGTTSEFDLAPFFASVAERPSLHLDELEVYVDHPRNVLERTRIPLSRARETEDGGRVFEVRVRMSLAAVIRGRLVHTDGSPAAGLVGALPMLGELPEHAEGYAVESDEDGTFTLRVRPSGPFALAAFVEGKRPATVSLDALVGQRLDLGPVVVDEGLSIEGVALRQGRPLVEASVMARARERHEERRFLSRRRAVTSIWVDGRFENPWFREETDQQGRFTFTGLAPIDFSLRVSNLAESRSSLAGHWEETVVRAPADDVRLEFGWTSIRIELSGDFEPEDEGRLVLKSADDSADFRLRGREPRYVSLAPPNTHFVGEVAFPGRQTVPLEVWTPEPGGEVLVPVRLERGDAAATLVIELESTAPEVPNEFSLTFLRADEDEDRPAKRRVAVEDARLRVEGVLPGRYRVRVRASAGDTLSAGLFHDHELELELRPGAELTRRITLRLGAGLRLSVRGEDGERIGGEYALFDAGGAPVELVMDVHAESGGRYGTSWQLLPHGVHESRSPLDPGRYRLVLRSEGYAERDVPVVLRAGAYEELDVTLFR